MQLAHDHASEGPAASSWLAGCGCGGGCGLCRKRFIARYDGGGGGDGSSGGGSVGGGGEGSGDAAAATRAADAPTLARDEALCRRR